MGQWGVISAVQVNTEVLSSIFKYTKQRRTFKIITLKLSMITCVTRSVVLKLPYWYALPDVSETSGIKQKISSILGYLGSMAKSLLYVWPFIILISANAPFFSNTKLSIDFAYSNNMIKSRLEKLYRVIRNLCNNE